MANKNRFNFVSPGIQVDEIDNSQLPREISTDRGPVIIGRTKRGPSMKPVKVNSFSEFVEIFGNTVPGGNGGDVWREGNETSPMYATYAAKAWLDNSAPATVVRLLGEQSTNASTQGSAGWTTTNDLNSSTGSNGGAFGLFVMNSGSNGDGALAATFYLQEGSMVLSGNLPNGAATASAASLIESVGDDKEFRAQIYDVDDNLVEEKVFNFNRDSQKYIRKVFNTNPIKTNSDLIQSDELQTYWLGSSYETTVNDIVTGSTAGDHYGVLLGLEGPDTDSKGNDFQFGQKTGQTGWFFSQNLGPSGSFDARSQQKLFKFESLEGGEWDSSNVKISIEDIKAPTNNFEDYGTFTVTVRGASDSDSKPQVLERYTGCNLDPTSTDFIAKKIGDKYRIWNETENRYEEYGDYENQSLYVRVDVHRDVKDGITEPSLLPFGVFGPLRNKGFTFTSGSTTVDEYKDVGNTFSDVFAKGIGDIPKTPGDAEFIETGDIDITGNIEFPKMSLRKTGSSGPVQTAQDAYFGVDTHISETSTRFDRGWSDLNFTLPAKYADLTSENEEVEYSWIFTLDDISGSTDGDGYWISGSHQNGNALTANGTDGFEEVLDEGFDKFTAPLHGGFDGFDITEKNPLRNDAIVDGSSRTDSYQTFTIKKAIDTVSDAEVVEHDLMVVPGIKDAHLTDYLIETAQRRGDSLAIIDLEDDYKPRHEGILTEQQQRGDDDSIVQTLKDRSVDNSYAATYTPWLQVQDTVTDSIVWLPPSVLALGAIGYTENNQALWFSPAGFTRGGLSSGVAGLPVLNVSRKLRKKDRDKLYDANINPIAKFPAEGIVILGGKTLQAERSALDRINVRRLMNHIKKGISRIASTTLFEPNVQATWNRFLNRANPFLQGIATQFGLDDYLIKLDDSTTTPDLVDRNALYAQIFVKPTKTIEFIQLDFVVTNDGASFQE